MSRKKRRKNRQKSRPEIGLAHKRLWELRNAGAPAVEIEAARQAVSAAVTQYRTMTGPCRGKVSGVWQPLPARPVKVKPKKEAREPKPVFKPGCTAFAARFEELQDLARDHQLRINVSIAQRGRTKTYHVMFVNDAGRVLDYWPATGTVMNKLNGGMGKVPDCWAALDEAARIAAEATMEARSGLADADAHLDAIMGR